MYETYIHMKLSDIMKSIHLQGFQVLNPNSFTLVLCPVTLETVTESCECISSLSIFWMPHAIPVTCQKGHREGTEKKSRDTQILRGLEQLLQEAKLIIWDSSAWEKMTQENVAEVYKITSGTDKTNNK